MSISEHSGSNELSFAARDTLETLAAMKQNELRYMPRDIFLQGQYQNEAATVLEAIDKYEKRRHISCEWCYKVVDHFHLPRNIVARTMNFVDRFLGIYAQELLLTMNTPKSDIAAGASRPYDNLKLFTTTSLFLALKLYQGNREGISGHSNLALMLPQLSNGEYTTEDVSKYEMTLLKTLGFNVDTSLSLNCIE
jgi:hypothetical protein